tara:strand:+ start:2017 stop:2307 length:291 start_codon:yes stop_codon:yes gene_type:complete
LRGEWQQRKPSFLDHLTTALTLAVFPDIETRQRVVDLPEFGHGVVIDSLHGLAVRELPGAFFAVRRQRLVTVLNVFADALVASCKLFAQFKKSLTG